MVKDRIQWLAALENMDQMGGVTLWLPAAVFVMFLPTEDWAPHPDQLT
jgi:hypothetical protein